MLTPKICLGRRILIFTVRIVSNLDSKSVKYLYRLAGISLEKQSILSYLDIQLVLPHVYSLGFLVRN